jgi:hypothetical protein
MYNVYFAIAANRVLVDSLTNQISIIDVYEKLNLSSFPVLINHFTLLYYLNKTADDPVEKELTVLCTQNTKEIFKALVKVDFKGNDTTRIVLAIEGFTLTEPGLIRAAVFDGKHELGALELETNSTQT